MHLVQRLQVLLFLLFPGFFKHQKANYLHPQIANQASLERIRFESKSDRKSGDVTLRMDMFQLGEFLDCFWILVFCLVASAGSSCRFNRGFVSVLVAQVLEIEHAEAVFVVRLPTDGGKPSHCADSIVDTY